MYLYYGAKTYYFLEKNNGKELKTFVIVMMTMGAVAYLFDNVFKSIGVLLVGWYLLHNIKRLSNKDKKSKTDRLKN
ncbi:MAG: hypothetical protein K9M44_03105 [Candidatus Pacebacteria bacterium]|nr:hypothetical protein [Candidatus Paceibacterota bacterium]